MEDQCDLAPLGLLPAGVRRTHLYQKLVDGMLRFLIEKVGGVEDVSAETLPDKYLARRTTGSSLDIVPSLCHSSSTF